MFLPTLMVLDANGRARRTSALWAGAGEPGVGNGARRLWHRASGGIAALIASIAAQEVDAMELALKGEPTRYMVAALKRQAVLPRANVFAELIHLPLSALAC